MTAAWQDPPHSHHATVGDAGNCPECRAWAINLVEDGPHAYLLTFFPDDTGPLTVALVRDWAPDGQVVSETAWATGCNLPRGVGIVEIPVTAAVESGVELFRLHEDAEAERALQAIYDAERARLDQGTEDD